MKDSYGQLLDGVKCTLLNIILRLGSVARRVQTQMTMGSYTILKGGEWRVMQASPIPGKYGCPFQSFGQWPKKIGH
jgi:hypothetical protein